MLIVNADDWGRSRVETDAALACHAAGRVTAVSAMMFMEDSERAAALAQKHGIDAGLHLNLSQPYTVRHPMPPAQAAHDRIVRFMNTSKYAVLLYHPALRQEFRDVYAAQEQEFLRLYGRPPSHVDGHQHRHLCINMLVDLVIPAGQSVRRNCHFRPGEKSVVNRFYRRVVDRRMSRRYVLPDYFFGLAQCLEGGSLERVAALAKETCVELMAHPGMPNERAALMGDDFARTFREIRLAGFAGAGAGRLARPFRVGMEGKCERRPAGGVHAFRE